VGIDLSKVGIGLFERNTKKKRLGPWQKIKRDTTNRNKKRKKELYESLGSRLLQGFLDAGLLEKSGVENTIHDRRRKKSSGDVWTEGTNAVAVQHTIQGTARRDDVSSELCKPSDRFFIVCIIHVIPPVSKQCAFLILFGGVYTYLLQ